MRIVHELGRLHRVRAAELRVPVDPAELAEHIRQGATRLEIDLSRDDLTVGIPTPIARTPDEDGS